MINTAAQNKFDNNMNIFNSSTRTISDSESISSRQLTDYLSLANNIVNSPAAKKMTVDQYQIINEYIQEAVSKCSESKLYSPNINGFRNNLIISGFKHHNIPSHIVMSILGLKDRLSAFSVFHPDITKLITTVLKDLELQDPELLKEKYSELSMDKWLMSDTADAPVPDTLLSSCVNRAYEAGAAIKARFWG